MPVIIDAIKLAYRQSKDGFVVSFVIHPNDEHGAIAKAAIGSQWQMRLVPLDDDGNAEEEAAELASSRPQKSWDEMKPAQQAGILCNEQSFHAYLQERHQMLWQTCFSRGMSPEECAAECVRAFCDVKSRKDITDDDRSGNQWRFMASAYKGWMRSPEVV